MKNKNIFKYLLAVIAVMAFGAILTIAVLRSSALPAVQTNNEVLICSINNLMQYITIALTIFGILAIIILWFGVQSIREEQKIHDQLKEDVGKRKIEDTILKAEVLRLQKHDDEAWDMIRQLDETEHCEVAILKAKICEAKNDLKSSLGYLDKAIKFKDCIDKHRIYYNRGNIFIKMAKQKGTTEEIQNKFYRDALKQFDKAIGEASSFMPAYNNKAISLRRLGQIANAIEVLTEAITIDPNCARLYYNRACYHCLLGHKPESLKDLEESAEKDRSFTVEHANSDPDFSAIKDSSEFKSLLEKYAKAIS